MQLMVSNNNNQTSLYKENDIVPITGKYKCIVCGSIFYFIINERFTICENCLQGREKEIWILFEEIEVINFGSI